MNGITARAGTARGTSGIITSGEKDPEVTLITSEITTCSWWTQFFKISSVHHLRLMNTYFSDLLLNFIQQREPLSTRK